MTLARRILTVTQGNLNNNHLYLTEVMDLFPEDVVGGENRHRLAVRTVRILWGGKPVDTDIVIDKHIFRRRGWVGKFFARYRVEAGDRILLEQLEPYLYRISPERDASADPPIADSQKLVPQREVATTVSVCPICTGKLDAGLRRILSRGLGGTDWLTVPIVVCTACYGLLGRGEVCPTNRRRQDTVEQAVSFWFRCNATH